MKKISIACCLSLMTGSLFGIEPVAKKEACEPSPQHKRVAVRYMSPKGIGYSQGYATLEGFFAPRDYLRGSWLPFLDLRGHVFDNGKLAGNAGLGFRYLSTSRVWGINTYYDYRNTKHQHYNQVSLGLETLGRIWDFRINGYLPVGWKQSPFRNYTFGRFEGNNMIVRATKDFALSGANAEVGAHVDRFHKTPLMFAAGPYYLTGKGASTWGGEFRVAVDLFSSRVRLEGHTAYDHFFKWTGQGQISLNFPFGGKHQTMPSKGQSCEMPVALNRRAVQPVERHEIVPVGQYHDYFAAINPATGKPYFFTFFNNTSSSLGTYESPYPTLMAVDGDILYVFPGNGSAYDTSLGDTLSDGLVLKQSQMLLGAGNAQSISTTVGMISIPALASSTPVLKTTETSGYVVTLNSDNTISGFTIGGSTVPAIYGNGIANFTSNQNIISGTNNATNAGISLAGASGELNVNSTFFTSNYNGITINTDSSLSALNVSGSSFVDEALNGIYLDMTSSIDTIALTSSAFNGNAVNGVFLDSASTVGSMDVSNCSFTVNQSAGILFVGAVDTLNVENSIFTFNYTDGIQFYNDSTTNLANIVNCSFNYQGNGIEVDGSNTIDNLNISGCTFAGNDTGIYNNGQITDTANIIGNTFVGQFYNGFELTAYPIDTLNIEGNTFNNNGLWDISLDDGNSASYVTIKGNQFNQSAYGVHADLTSSLSCSIANNTFNENNTYGISITSAGTGSCAVDIADNQFAGVYTNANSGYATNIAFTGTGSICIGLVDNTTYPISNSSGDPAYLLVNTGTTFYLTEASASSNVGNLTHTDTTFTPECSP